MSIFHSVNISVKFFDLKNEKFISEIFKETYILICKYIHAYMHAWLYEHTIYL
jgi:hypothetical protein